MVRTEYLIKLLSVVVCLSVLAACSDKDDKDAPSGKKELSVTTTILTRAVSAVKTAFKSGDEMNVFVKTAGASSAENFVNGMKATFDGNAWTLVPAVELSSDSKVYVYAVYPYNNSYTNAAAVPVTVAAQTDYLYSGAATVVSYTSPQASLAMKHALDILSLNIASEGYGGAGKIESIVWGGDGFGTEGTLDIGTGVVTATKKGTYTLPVDKNITAEGWTENLPQCFVLPFNSTGKNISLIAKIDGQDYTVLLPKMVVEAGMKYVFHLALTSNGLSLVENKTEVISLNKESEVTDLGAYGVSKITYAATVISLPEFKGEQNVSGTVYWGDGVQGSYTFPGTHTFSSAENHEVKIETWGATKLNFPDLKDIEEVDLSAF